MRASYSFISSKEEIGLMVSDNRVGTDIVIPILALVSLDGKPIANKKLRSVELVRLHHPHLSS